MQYDCQVMPVKEIIAGPNRALKVVIDKSITNFLELIYCATQHGQPLMIQ